MISLILEEKKLGKAAKIAAGAGAVGAGGYIAAQPAGQQAAGKALHKVGKALGKEREAAEIAKEAPKHVGMGYLKSSTSDIGSKVKGKFENIKSNIKRAHEDKSENIKTNLELMKSNIKRAYEDKSGNVVDNAINFAHKISKKLED